MRKLTDWIETALAIAPNQDNELMVMMKPVRIWQRGLAIALATSLLLLSIGATVARADDDEDLTIDPLELPEEPDPLVPKGTTILNQDFSPRQRREFEAELARLATAAAAAFADGDPETALEIWYRELRLRRYLGPLAETIALGRVGEIAWENSLSADLQRIAARLEEIETTAVEDEALEPPLFTALAEAYTKIRLQNRAVAMYERVLAQVRASGDRPQLARTLNTLAQLQTAWFRYAEAAVLYEELVAIARDEFDAASETYYLEQLVYLFSESEQWAAAIATQQQLAEQYLLKERWPELTNLYITIGDQYAQLEELEAARQSYQQAFSVAWAQQQYAYASDALTQLAELYYRSDQLEAALQVYEEQLKAAQTAQNAYGLMRGYDRMGEIYLELQDYRQAEAAFAAGLELARALDHQERYFENRLAEVVALRGR
ncbi:MAG: tetratricopeptide repeat protein [Spirulinaceae cyanobacterium SM2_1_0]|nr:tetratricopeptide repeat protein [Spirulinaceae cyanobacterium SM2_1_0]